VQVRFARYMHLTEVLDLACRKAPSKRTSLFAARGVISLGGVAGEHRPSWHMHNLFHWVSSYASVLAILVTLGVAVLLVCCLECTNCPSREKDNLFSRHES
jgi:hypothetical protein